MDLSVFRAYDIRGTYPDQINEYFAFDLARVLANEFKKQGLKSIAVGFDARHSSKNLASHFISGLVYQNPKLQVFVIGQVPTPYLYFATRKNGGLSKSGVMITASHNPGNYNGFKLAINAKRLSGETIQNLAKQFNFLTPLAPELKKSLPYDDLKNKPNSQIQFVDIAQEYLNEVHQSSNFINSNSKLKIVLDCGNGITGAFAPKIFESFGFEVVPLYCDLDANFPNHEPDCSRAENLKDLQKMVLNQKADLGLAFDGDGDRLAVVDNLGQIVSIDLIILLFALNIKNNSEKNISLIHDVKCSNLISEELKPKNINVIMCATGHSFISEKISQTGAEFAGEMSGHLFFNDRWGGFDDGIYAGVRIAEIVQNSKKTLSEITSVFPSYYNTPEILVSFKTDAEKFSFMASFKELFKEKETQQYQVYDLDGIRLNFHSHFATGWGIVRASNTSAKLTIRFEAKNKKDLTKISDFFVLAIKKVNPQIANIVLNQLS